MTSLTCDLAALRKAACHLLEAGFTLPDVPMSLLLEGVVMVAYNQTTDEGAIIKACELGAFAHYGVAHLRRGEAVPKPFVDRSEVQKLEAFIARVVSGLESSGAGNREALLSKAAFTLGGLVGAGQLEQGYITQELLERGVSAGLPLPETRSSVARNLRKGMAKPWQFGSGRSRVGGA
jgi:hypothetical protein